ncbi:MAG: lytic murein transglycosylase B [Burkholderiales bacterium]
MPCLVLALAAFSAFAGPLRAQGTLSFIDRPDVVQFANEIATAHRFDVPNVLQTLRQARHQPAIIRAMEPVRTGQRSWQSYRSRTVTRSRIEDGARFWVDHQAALARAEDRFGIPAEIIVAIIGVETHYGRNTGTWRVLDALATLAFDYPRRSAYFRSELEQLFLYARETGTEIATLRGSFAGAVGIPQFMPGSFMRYAIDFDGDGRRDVLNNVADAIGSVGNFLSRHGWLANEPIAFPATVSGDAHALPLLAGIEPAFRIGELDQYGITLAASPDEDALCALIEFDTPDAPSEFWVGLNNFYVITRYNQSSFYALSVHTLAQSIKAEAGLRGIRSAQ